MIGYPPTGAASSSAAAACVGTSLCRSPERQEPIGQCAALDPALLAGPYVEHLPHHTHGMMCARLGSSLLYS